MLGGCACAVQVSEETFTWTTVNALLMAISIVGFFVFVLVYNAIYSASPGFFGVAVATYSRGTFWALFFLSLGICVLLDFAVEYIRREFFPTSIDVIIEHERYVRRWRDVCVCAGEGGGLLLATTVFVCSCR